MGLVCCGVHASPTSDVPPSFPLSDYLQRILTARVYDVAEETPLDVAPGLSARLANTVYLKREDTQPVFSFKVRGAYNKMVGLPAVQLARGVICASAGNPTILLYAPRTLKLNTG